MIQMRDQGGARIAEFWCRSPLWLDEVFERFRAEFPVTDFIRDYENVWEWYDGRTADGLIGFNISRKHNWGESIPDDPVRISLSVDPSYESVEVVGQRLARALNTNIFRGSVKYQRGDDLAFDIQQTFEPPT